MSGQRIKRVHFACEVCGTDIALLPSQVRQRGGVIRYCSHACAGVAIRKPAAYTEATCSHCGCLFTKRADHVFVKNYCSRECQADGRRNPDARWNNKNKIREYMRGYTARNRGRHNARSRAWNVANRATKAAQRRARRANAKTGDFSADQWEAMKLHYEHRCLCCGKSEPAIRLEPDHVIPVVLGGKHTETNMQPLCRSCNASKGAKTTDYRFPVFVYRVLKV